MALRKPYLISLVSLLLMGAAPSRTQTYTAGQIIQPDAVTENESNVYTYLQAGVDTFKTGSVDSAAIANGTIITTDIASETITTSNILNGTILSADIASVSASLFTSLSSLPSGSGVIPVANLPGVQSTIIDFSRTAAAGSGTQAVTGMGFQPTALILNCGDNSVGTRAGWGVGDDASDETQLIDNATTMTASSATLTSIINGGNAMDAVLTSLDSDGFTLTWTKSNSGMQVDCGVLGLR